MTTTPPPRSPARDDIDTVELPTVELSVFECPTRALVLDGEPMTRALMRRILERRGVEVAEAVDGSVATAILENWLPDVIFVDVQHDSFEALTNLAVIQVDSRWQNIPVIVTTTVFGTPLEGKLRQRADVVVDKPYRPNDIYDALDRTVVLSAPHDPLRPSS